jgi:glycosyltransferase involved in cell wall biosynthesis
LVEEIAWWQSLRKQRGNSGLDNMDWPKISIVTPSYNQARFLERTILSVLEQGYPNLEYIIIDGGSSDGSVDIIRKYQQRLAYWVSEPDQGQADAIRKGFTKSSGEILAWLNADDLYLPGALLRVAEAFQKNPEADLVFGNIYLIDESDRRIGEIRFVKFDFPTLIFEGGNLHQTGAFWTRRIYDQVGGINPRYRFCMDFDFFCRVAAVGHLVHLKQHLACFRLHKDAKSLTIEDIGISEHEEIQRRYLPESMNTHYLFYRRTLCQMKRFVGYLAQGDVDYALRGLVKRIVRVRNQ